MADGDPQGGGQATATPPVPDQNVQPTPAAAQDAAQPGGAADWLKTAQVKPDIQPGQAQQTAQMAEQPAPPPAPMVVTSLKRGGLLGVVDSIADVLAGKQRPELGKDADGDLYVKQHTLTKGEQWMKIAATALHGAAAGYAAGQGRGNQGKAGLAGIQAGQQDQDRQKANAKDMSAEVQQQQMQKANNQMLQMKMAEQTWNQARQKVTASQEDIKFNDEQTKQLTDPVEKGGGGGRVIGTAAHVGDIGEILKVQPDVMQHLVQKGTIQIRKNLDADGNVIGIKAILMPDEWAKTTLPPGAIGHIYNPLTKQIEEFTYADPVTKGEQAVHDAAAVTAKDEADEKARKIAADQAALDEKKANTANLQSETEARNKELPGKLAETASGTVKNYAEAGAANARASAVTSGAQLPDGTPNPRFEAMAQALYDGDVLPADLKREAKGANLDPNELMARAVEIGQQRGKPWSESIIKEEQKFAESPKTQAALDGINRVIDPSTGYMKQMLDRARAADLGTHGAFNSANLAVRRFFGEDTAKNFNTSVTELRRSIAGLIGNPLLGGSETDKKLAQADELIGKSPTLRNLESASETLNAALAAQKTSIIGNNRFLQRRYGAGGQGVQQQSGLVTVKTASGHMGQIPAANLDKFKQDNPGTTVLP